MKIAVSAGEVSGDLHLAEIVTAVRKRYPECALRGMAGQASARAGVDLVIDSFRVGSAMGFLELLRPLAKIIGAYKVMCRLLKEWRPQLLIVVDYPDFNLRLARVAKSLGIKVLYYIPPKIWAWRSYRMRAIARTIDHVAVIFPFEEEYYRRHGYEAVTYVGNPTAQAVVREYGSDVVPDSARRNSVVILPGSRRAEVERMLVPLVRSYNRLKQDDPSLLCTVVMAPNMNLEEWKGRAEEAVGTEGMDGVEWRTGNGVAEMRDARVGILKSGTCNLEAAMVGLPFVCVYSGTRLAEWIVQNIVRLKEYSPVNIVQPGTVRELIQVAVSDVDVAHCVREIVSAGPARTKMQDAFSEMRTKLISGLHGEGAERVVDIASRLMECS